MDYIFVSSIFGVLILTIIASYDIACQFFVHFFSRVLQLPPRLRETTIPPIVAMVPKAHIAGHGSSCQGRFSFNWRKGVGRTEGEGIERGWSGLGKAGPSTKEMTPSGRRETIDDFCGYTNWKKVIGLGE